MERKDMYDLRELYDKLTIPIAELGRRAGVSELTVAKIRDGHSARRSSVNALLATFAKIYELDNLSIDTVQGIIIRDKLARSQKDVPQIDEKPSVPEVVVTHTQAITEKPKRAYNRKSATGLPDGCVLASEFARRHGRDDRTFRDDMIIGLGPGVPWGMGDEMTVEKEHVDYSERVKPGRPKEKERYLTQEQQKAALEFWRRHDVAFSECDRAECGCHTLKGKQ